MALSRQVVAQGIVPGLADLTSSIINARQRAEEVRSRGDEFIASLEQREDQFQRTLEADFFNDLTTTLGQGGGAGGARATGGGARGAGGGAGGVDIGKSLPGLGTDTDLEAFFTAASTGQLQGLQQQVAGTQILGQLQQAILNQPENQEANLSALTQLRETVSGADPGQAAALISQSGLLPLLQGPQQADPQAARQAQLEQILGGFETRGRGIGIEEDRLQDLLGGLRPETALAGAPTGEAAVADITGTAAPTAEGIAQEQQAVGNELGQLQNDRNVRARSLLAAPAELNNVRVSFAQSISKTPNELVTADTEAKARRATLLSDPAKIGQLVNIFTKDVAAPNTPLAAAIQQDPNTGTIRVNTVGDDGRVTGQQFSLGMATSSAFATLPLTERNDIINLLANGEKAPEDFAVLSVALDELDEHLVNGVPPTSATGKALTKAVLFPAIDNETGGAANIAGLQINSDGTGELAGLDLNSSQVSALDAIMNQANPEDLPELMDRVRAAKRPGATESTRQGLTQFLNNFGKQGRAGALQ